MKSTIGVYTTHSQAVDAAAALKDAGYPVKQISIMGKAETELIDDKMHVMPKDPINIVGVGAGTAVGTAIGILTGVGLFAIPGFGFLFGAGALVGAIAGFDFGLLGGGIASVLTTVGVNNDLAKDYQKELENGKYLVVAQGTDEEVQLAATVLQQKGSSARVETHK